MAPFAILISYLILRPALTLVTELPRAMLMLRWKGGYLVSLHLGSFGHRGGWTFRIGKLVFRIHPLWFIFRGSISDTPSEPSRRQFWWWCFLPLLTNALIFISCVGLVWYGHLDTLWRLAAALFGFLAFIDLGVGVFREMEPLCMHCGLVYAGPLATLRTMRKFGVESIPYLQGLRSYLRDDFQTASDIFGHLIEKDLVNEELLEDHAYASLVLGATQASLDSFEKLKRRYVPTATQMSVAAMALWKSGEPLKASEMIDKAIEMTYGHAMARNVRGWILLELNYGGVAVFDLSKAVEHSPEYATAWANLSRAYFEANMFDESLKAAETGYQHDSTDLNVLHRLIEIYTWLHREEDVRRIWGQIQILEGHFR